MRITTSSHLRGLGVVATVLTALVLAGPAHGASTASTAIVVDGTQPGAKISNADFGADFLAPDGGMGSFDTATGAFYPSFVRQLGTSAYVGSLRFPGGITAESYDWERAIGPESQRTDNPIGPSSGPTDSSVGPDEFGRLLDKSGASGVVTTDFGTGSAAEAAAFVQYMTGAAGSSVWADRRVANGHRAPYDVPYWEVGNEEYSTDYWRTGTVVTDNAPAGANCPTVATCLYIFGGSTSFANQKVVGYADRTASASTSTGAADQSFYVAYPPVDTSSTPSTVEVGGQAWTQVSSLASVAAGADDYTLDPTSGEISFGDGTHGAIPPAGQTITASYVSGPHDGFNQFYTAMKQANPHIQVCSTDTSTDFIEAMGSSYPYDCLQDHPYVGSGDASPTLPIATYENDVMAAPTTETAAAQTLEATITADAGHPIPLELSEYGQLINATPDPSVVPYYLNSLDEALVNASQLADWITLGVPVADRQLLAAELPAASAVTSGLPGAAPYAVTGAITTPGPQTVVQPTAQYVRLMSPLAGESLLGSQITGNPTLTTTSSGSAVGAVSVVAGSGRGAVDVVAINRSATGEVPATIDLAGFHGRGRAVVRTLDGPSALSDNTAAAPNTVTTSSSAVPVAKGQAELTLPAHSISLVQIDGL
jgi:alpha-N-arabinofuranosidase